MPPMNLRRSGCRLPTMRHWTGNCFPNQRNQRCAPAQEQRELEGESLHEQKQEQGLAEPLENLESPSWQAHGLPLSLEPRGRC